MPQNAGWIRVSAVQKFAQHSGTLLLCSPGWKIGRLPIVDCLPVQPLITECFARIFGCCAILRPITTLRSVSGKVQRWHSLPGRRVYARGNGLSVVL